MRTVLTQLNGVPGVVGTLLCDLEGRLLAQTFPPLFEPVLLQQAATTLADGAIGLETTSGAVGLLDFRYGEARLVVKPMEQARLLVLCAKDINLQLLLISTSVAVKRLAPLVQEAMARPAPAAAPAGVPQFEGILRDGSSAPAKQAEKSREEKPKKMKMPKWTPSL
jgi:predicted regulator of Ras-like GTPase activity (Roadblock/LC7/MglB family)